MMDEMFYVLLSFTFCMVVYEVIHNFSGKGGGK